MKNQKGFSLVELLVVVIIIAIIAAIAIPSLLASRRAANEASAISSLRTVHSAQATYFSTVGGNASYGTLVNLASTAGGDLIDDVLGGADPSSKSGYDFTVTLATGHYCGTAVPQSGQGTRSFAISTAGVLYSSPNATPPTCTAATGVISTGSPLQ